MDLPVRDVVVLLPGIGGSVLQRDGKDVWSFSGGAAVRALLSLGRSIERLALTDDPPEVDDLGDGVTAPRLLPDLHLIPGFWKIDGYQKIAERLRTSPGVTPGQNYFELPYDWRRDNRVAARRLRRLSHDWLASWRERSGNADAKLVLVGHSMGGIVARIFLELYEGWRDTRVLVTFGTPYAGSINALDFLVNGFSRKIGPVGIDLSAMLRSFTSVYQLLPVFRCLDTGNGLTRLADAGPLPNVDPVRLDAALGLHAELRAEVDANRAADYEGTGGYDVRPVVGDFQPTRQTAKLDGAELVALYEREGVDESGDGTVPRLSAMPHEHLDDWSNVAFYAEAHASLQNFDPVLVQLSSLVRNLAIDTTGYYALNARLRVSVEDLYLAAEPVEIRATPEYPVAGLAASVVAVATGEEVARVPLVEGGEGWWTAEVAPLPAGDYRVTVGAAAGVDPVTDIFAVVDPDAPGFAAPS